MNHAEDFLESLKNTGSPPSTLESYGNAIQDFEKAVGTADPGQIEPVHFDRYLAILGARGLALSTRRTRAMVLRSFFAWLHSRSLITQNPCQNVKPPKEKRGPIDPLTPVEIRKAVFAPVPSQEDQIGKTRFVQRQALVASLTWRRDSALIGLGYQCGLRAGELSNLRVFEFVVCKGGANVTIMGKHADEPAIRPVDSQVTHLVMEWFAARTDAGIDTEFLFCSIEDPGKKLSYEAIRGLLERRLQRVGVVKGHRRLSPHVLRYSIGTHMHASGCDIMAISHFLRHKSIETTQRYIRLSGGETGRGILKHVPWNTLGSDIK